MTRPFDPIWDVRFRGKPLRALTHGETLEALVQALQQVKYLEETRPPGVWPPFVPTEPPAGPVPFPPRTEFNVR